MLNKYLARWLIKIENILKLRKYIYFLIIFALFTSYFWFILLDLFSYYIKSWCFILDLKKNWMFLIILEILKI